MRSLREKRLLKSQESSDESKGSMLAIISLLLLLLPFLLLTTSPQKLAALGFQLPKPGEGLPPLPKGVIEDLWVQAEGSTLTVHKRIRRSDVGANEGQSEASSLRIAPKNDSFDLHGLQATLRELKTLDPARDRVQLNPNASSTAGDVVTLMDALRSDATGPLFGEVILGGSE